MECGLKVLQTNNMYEEKKDYLFLCASLKNRFGFSTALLTMENIEIFYVI